MERVKTTFHMDFAIAERFGVNAIKDTYKRAVKEWLDNCAYYTELVVVLNQRCWYFYDKFNEKKDERYKRLSKLYSDLFYEARDKGFDTYKHGTEEFEHFWSTLD